MQDVRIISVYYLGNGDLGLKFMSVSQFPSVEIQLLGTWFAM